MSSKGIAKITEARCKYFPKSVNKSRFDANFELDELGT